MHNENNFKKKINCFDRIFKLREFRRNLHAKKRENFIVEIFGFNNKRLSVFCVNIVRD